MSGSIGTIFARLWKCEVGAIIYLPRPDTPWDICPIIGISGKLGYKFWISDSENNRFIESRPKISKKLEKNPNGLFVANEAAISQLNRILKSFQ